MKRENTRFKFKMAASTKKTPNVYKFVVSFLNEEFGGDVKNLSKAKDIYSKVLESKKSLESQLSLATNDIPSEVDQAVASAENIKTTIKRLNDEKERLYHEVKDHIHHVQPLVKEVSKLTDQIQQLQQYVKYLTCVTKVEEYSLKIESGVADNLEEAVESFYNLTDLYTRLHCSKCQNLKEFIKETINYWYKSLKLKLASEFEETLKTLGWPFVATSVKAVPSQSKELCEKMELLFIQLLHIQLPESMNSIGQPPSLAADALYFKPLLLPLQLMVKSLRKRFKYHFCGTKQTNNLERPEWYFSQVLCWINSHNHFIEQRIQPILDKTDYHHVNGQVEFMSGLVSMVTEKMANDLSHMMDNEHMFSHLIDEAIMFDKELRGNNGYPAGLPSSLTVLIRERAFQKWMHIEQQFAGEKMDVMMESPTAWQSQYRDIADADEHKVPECGESFVTLMLTITDRYKGLPSTPHKLRFLELQLHLFEDFRIRLVQIMKGVTHDPLGDVFCAILNAVHYVTEVLQEWSNLPFFLQLQFQQTKSDNKESREDDQTSDLADEIDRVLQQMNSGVFEENINMYNELKSEMLKNVVKCIAQDVQSRSQPYRKDRWISLPSQKDVIGQSLSSSACEMILVLKDHLMHVQSQLSKPLFTLTWQQVAQRLDKFIVEEVILQNRFNEGGALQLQFDMTRNLFPLFGEFTHKPENYFREVKESIIILTLNTGSAMLLKDVISRDTVLSDKKDSEATAALHEQGIYKLTKQKANTILDIRTNS